MFICPDCRHPIETTDQCSSCGWKGKTFGSIKCMLSSSDMDDHVFQQYHENYENIAHEDIETSILEERYVSLLADRIVHLSPSMKDKKVCDVGSGKGFLLRRIQQEKPSYLAAVDISLNYLKSFEDPIHTFQANAENMPFENMFDIVTCTDVMEHVINVGNFLHSLNKAIKIGGYAIIRVPYKENLLNYSMHHGCKYQFAHLRDFNKENLKRLIHYAGFKTIKTYTEGFSIQIPQEFWWKGYNRKVIFSKIQAYIRKNLITHDEDINRWNPHLSRLFLKPLELIIIAQKKEDLKNS